MQNSLGTSFLALPALGLLLVGPWLAPAQACAADIVVHVTGLSAPLGDVGCALFDQAEGFPLDSSRARLNWQPALAAGITCRFSGVAPGRYAVSVGHDRNGNHRVDTSLLGIPVEPWGVSNNVRPRFRAPRFDEAAFTVDASAAEVALDVRVAP